MPNRMILKQSYDLNCHQIFIELESSGLKIQIKSNLMKIMSIQKQIIKIVRLSSTLKKNQACVPFWRFGYTVY